MLTLILAVLFPVFSVVLFREFERYNIHVFQAIVFNYLGAVILGVLLFVSPSELINSPSKEWIWFSVLIGFLFLLNFFLIAKTTVVNGVSMAVFANKISLVLSVGVTVLYIGEEFGLFKIIAVLVSVLAIYLLTISSNGKLKTRNLVLPSLVFITTGIVEIIINLVQKSHFSTQEGVGFFVTVIFLISFIFGVIGLLIKKSKVKFKNIVAGFVLAVPNVLGVYFFIKALNESENSASVFPILHIGSLLFACLVGYFIYKEDLNWKNWIGILLAIFTLLLISN